MSQPSGKHPAPLHCAYSVLWRGGVAYIYVYNQQNHVPLIPSMCISIYIYICSQQSHVSFLHSNLLKATFPTSRFQRTTSSLAKTCPLHRAHIVCWDREFLESSPNVHVCLRCSSSGSNSHEAAEGKTNVPICTISCRPNTTGTSSPCREKGTAFFW